MNVFVTCQRTTEASGGLPDASEIAIPSGGSIDNDIECPTCRIEFEGEIRITLLGERYAPRLRCPVKNLAVISQAYHPG